MLPPATCMLQCVYVVSLAQAGGPVCAPPGGQDPGADRGLSAGQDEAVHALRTKHAEAGKHTISRLFLLFRFLLHLPVGPVVDGLQRRDQGPAPLGQGILHGGRDGRIDRAGDKAVALQLPQALGQHGGRDAHHLALHT